MKRSKAMGMNTRFEKSVHSSDEWYTPKEMLEALGEFDLDPCAPIRRPRRSCMTGMQTDYRDSGKGVCG